MLIGARFVQGIGGALASAVILGMIVTMFPEPARPGESDRRLRLRRLRRRLDRAARRRRPHRGDQLALDLPHQPADRHRSSPTWRCAWSPSRDGIGLHEGADFPGAALITRSLMLGVFTILQITEWGWVDARTLGAQRRLGGAAGGLHPPPGDDRQPADAAAPVPLAQRRRRQRAAGAAGRRHVRDVLPRRPLPAAGARLQRRSRSASPSCRRRS